MVQTEVGVEWEYGPEQNEKEKKKTKPLEKQTVMSSCYTQEFVKKC